MEAVRCWLCGIEPLEVYDVSTVNDARPRFIAGRWPAGDHEHAERAPTPGELEQAGHEVLMRIRRAALTVL